MGRLQSLCPAPGTQLGFHVNEEPHLQIVCVKRGNGNRRRTQRGLRAALRRGARLWGR